MSARSIPAEIRERLRAHQDAEAQALAAATAATARRESAELRRSEVVAAQDELVRAAAAQEEASMVDLAAASGVDRAAALLDISVVTLRRLVRVANDAPAGPSAAHGTKVGSPRLAKAENGSRPS
jgi:hypothetical protein